MKKLSLLVLVITATASSYAIPANIGTTVKKVATDEIVTSLKVYNNVEVVLTNNDAHEISIVGEKADVDKTTVKIINGELTITNSTDDYLNEMGVGKLFPPGTTTTVITEYIKDWVKQHPRF